MFSEYAFVTVSMSKLKNLEATNYKAMLSSNLPLLCSGLTNEEDLLLGLGLLILTPSATAQLGGGSGFISFCAITVTVLPQHSLQISRYLSSECRIAECGVISLWGLHCTLPGLPRLRCTGGCWRGCGLRSPGQDSEDTALGHTASCAAFPSAHQHRWKSLTFTNQEDRCKSIMLGNQAYELLLSIICPESRSKRREF